MDENEKVIGVDEAGRGPLAGPVFAGAAYIRGDVGFLKEIKDSKKISEKKREELYNQIIESEKIITSIAYMSSNIIDTFNILEATKLAMKEAVEGIKKEGLVVVDGNFKIPVQEKQKSIIRADEKIIECSIASIVAKVSRDKVMRKMGKKHPVYGFEKHKGYPTKMHKKALSKYGPCSLHRKTFKLK